MAAYSPLRLSASTLLYLCKGWKISGILYYLEVILWWSVSHQTFCTFTLFWLLFLCSSSHTALSPFYTSIQGIIFCCEETTFLVAIVFCFWSSVICVAASLQKMWKDILWQLLWSQSYATKTQLCWSCQSLWGMFTHSQTWRRILWKTLEDFVYWWVPTISLKISVKLQFLKVLFARIFL